MLTEQSLGSHSLFFRFDIQRGGKLISISLLRAPGAHDILELIMKPLQKTSKPLETQDYRKNSSKPWLDSIKLSNDVKYLLRKSYYIYTVVDRILDCC